MYSAIVNKSYTNNFSLPRIFEGSREHVNYSLKPVLFSYFFKSREATFFFVCIKYDVKHVSKIDSDKGKNVASCEKSRQGTWKTGFRRIEILTFY